MDPRFEPPALEIDLTAPPSSDVAALAAVVADMGRWACELEDRLSALETLLHDDGRDPALNRLADYRLEVFYMPELADCDRDELRRRAQAALEEALPGLAARLRCEGLLVVAEDEAHVLL